MVGHGGSSAGLYLSDPTSPIPSHCASIVLTSTLRVKLECVRVFCRTEDVFPCMVTPNNVGNQSQFITAVLTVVGEKIHQCYHTLQ